MSKKAEDTSKSGRDERGRFLKGNNETPVDLPRKARDQPQIATEVRSVFLRAMEQVTSDPLCVQAMYLGLKFKCLEDPLAFMEWANRMLPSSQKIDIETTKKIIVTFEEAQPPEGWQPRLLDQKEAG